MRKQIQRKCKQVERSQGQELKCDVCGIVLHQYVVSVDGKKIIGVLIEQDGIAHGVKFTVCRRCRDVVERVMRGGGLSDMYDLEKMFLYLNAKLNQIIEALCAVSVNLGGG